MSAPTNEQWLALVEAVLAFTGNIDELEAAMDRLQAEAELVRLSRDAGEVTS